MYAGAHSRHKTRLRAQTYRTRLRCRVICRLSTEAGTANEHNRLARSWRTHRLGSELHDPFMTMSFLGLEVIPSLKLTDQGLVDVDRMQLVPLFVDEP